MTSTEEGRSGAPGRPTRQRRAIAAALDAATDFRSAQQLHEHLAGSGTRVGLATVYRPLQLLAEQGAVDMMRSEDGEAVYRRCSTRHHHHLVCRACGAAVEIQGPAVESWAEQTASEHDYAEVTHTLEIFGVCPGCR